MSGKSVKPLMQGFKWTIEKINPEWNEKHQSSGSVFLVMIQRYGECIVKGKGQT